jgi:hypothetical protein
MRPAGEGATASRSGTCGGGGGLWELQLQLLSAGARVAAAACRVERHGPCGHRSVGGRIERKGPTVIYVTSGVVCNFIQLYQPQELVHLLSSSIKKVEWSCFWWSEVEHLGMFGYFFLKWSYFWWSGGLPNNPTCLAYCLKFEFLDR